MKVIVSHDNDGRIVSIGVPMRGTVGIAPRAGQHVITIDVEVRPLHHYLVGHRVDVTARPPRLVQVAR
jgi:hypothetical protein